MPTKGAAKAATAAKPAKSTAPPTKSKAKSTATTKAKAEEKVAAAAANGKVKKTITTSTTTVKKATASKEDVEADSAPAETPAPKAKKSAAPSKAAPSKAAATKKSEKVEKPAKAQKSSAKAEKDAEKAKPKATKAKVAKTAEGTSATEAPKHGTKRPTEEDQEDGGMEEGEKKPDEVVSKKPAKARKIDEEEEVDELEKEAPRPKRGRRGAAARGAVEPVGPLNSPPGPIPPVTLEDVKAGKAVEVTSGLVSSSGEGSALPRKLFVWGSGDSGQFGVGPPEDDKPTKLNKPKPFGNKDISVAIDDDEMGRGGLEAVIGGGMHSVIIDGNGRILTSGADDYGTLGRKHRGSADDMDECYYNFKPVEGLSPTGKGVDPKTGAESDVERYRATRVASADAAGVALDDQGRLRSWGYFKDGEGRVCFADSDSEGHNKEQWYPIPLGGIENERFSQVSAGENHILALSLDGKVYSWGLNNCSQLGRASNPRKMSEAFTKSEPPKDVSLTPTVVNGLKEVTRVFCGLSNGFAVEKSGRVMAWGLNTKGQTGTGLKRDKVSVPSPVPALSPTRHNGSQVVQIVGGNFHTAFLLSNGEVYICGDSDEGKLGLPEGHEAIKEATPTSPVVVRSPVKVEFPAPPPHAPEGSKTASGGTKIVSLSAGMRFTLALSADGTLYSWGTTSDDAMGQPADDEGGDQSKDVPTAVAMPGKLGAWSILAASTAGQHSLALAVKAEL
ncbi:RCC1/BLIP-II [Violaceomyces palustris]|uniref:RCC1/BLIP-II n=1 Tax=Violaceomyces palustris TaxID=1673888 RepID=A0ACD0P601_9BASI|nr:RCC1/BLIP-II [Violaceomyces palustris]